MMPQKNTILFIPPVRTPMLPGWYYRPSIRWHLNTNCGLLRLMSAVVSAQRSTFIQKRLFVFGPQSAPVFQSNGLPHGLKHLSPTPHGRDHVSTAEMAFDANNKIVALKVDTIANIGAYMSLFSSSVPTYLYATLLSGQYVIPAIHANVRTVYTNTVPVDAYRGAGRRKPVLSWSG